MLKLFFLLPNALQNLIISIINYRLYAKRYGGNYKLHKLQVSKIEGLELAEIKKIQEREALKFVNFAATNSEFYKEKYKHINLSDIKSVSDFNKLPILEKEELRKNIDIVYTIDKKEGSISKTGGTTGKPLVVLFANDDLQKRFAYLDIFRSRFGYKLGKKTAWFSGKKLLSSRDVKKNRFWKYDFINKVRYYSTFHIDQKHLKHYISDLIKFEPEYFVGFPSTLLEIAKYGVKNNIVYSNNNLKAIFPTAESITPTDRKTIESYFKASIFDQYASSEGAPFIFECVNNKLHLELSSGVFEVLNKENVPTDNGRLVLTSFSTHGTPLIRYDIGDNLKLAENETCNCGNNNPIVSEILGRINDYVFSPEMGKVNLGNISNTLKGVEGIVKFQVIQDQLNELNISIVVDVNGYNTNSESIFIQNW
ncbi:phenylacetate--CoA ligase family protein, partial [Flavobacteriaceae bacterium]|nr:phenylacetate--CoA ligase family protein [Flavobacteriaceae bacterium]